MLLNICVCILITVVLLYMQPAILYDCNCIICLYAHVP